ncbi:MAG TPA: hypothetical protein GX014_01455 [Firmicutes bacterium]|nr:hypothetical protein [Bacillota bacterium]
MPYFVWFGVLGLLLLYAAGITMFLAKRKNMPHLRRHHSLLGKGAAFSLAVHAVWANLDHMGRSVPLLGWIGLAAIFGVFLGYCAILRTQRVGGRKWSRLHWQIQLLSMVIATVHAAWMIVRVLSAP